MFCAKLSESGLVIAVSIVDYLTLAVRFRFTSIISAPLSIAERTIQIISAMPVINVTPIRGQTSVVMIRIPMNSHGYLTLV